MQVFAENLRIIIFDGFNNKKTGTLKFRFHSVVTTDEGLFIQ